mgnify:CR=1 FL=1
MTGVQTCALPISDIQTLSKCIKFKLAADDYRLTRLYVVLDYVTVLSRCDDLENFRGSPVREIRGENECIAISRGLFIGLENLSPERYLVALAGGKGEGLIFKKGKILRKVPEDKLLEELKKEIDLL